jgi:hypothetical protein
MERDWQFAGSSKQGEPFEIQGVNVWGQGWQVEPGEEAQVNDPVYGQGFIFKVYSIQDDQGPIKFAAGELSPGEWGFYVRD